LTIARRRPRGKHQEEIMHPVLMRQVAADHISEMHAKAQDERLARQAHRARRRAPSARLRLPASGTLSYDDPRLAAGQRAATHERPCTAYDLGEARTCGNGSSEVRVLLPATESSGDATKNGAGSGQ
jgi:hypothetical protein